MHKKHSAHGDKRQERVGGEGQTWWPFSNFDEKASPRGDGEPEDDLATANADLNEEPLDDDAASAMGDEEAEPGEDDEASARDDEGFSPEESTEDDAGEFAERRSRSFGRSVHRGCSERRRRVTAA